MNVIYNFTWKTMWKNRTRTLVTIIAVLLSTAFFTAITTIAFSIQNYLVRSVQYTDGDYYVKYVYTTDAELSKLQNDEMVSSVAKYSSLGFVDFESNSLDSGYNSYELATGDKSFYEQMPVHIIEGRLPENSGEIVLPASLIELLKSLSLPYSIGAEITFNVNTDCSRIEIAPSNIEAKIFTRKFTIVGIIENTQYDDGTSAMPSMLTFEDANEGTPLYYHLYAKTHNTKDALLLSEYEYGADQYLNFELLNYLGTSMFDNLTTLITSVVIFLLVIVFIGTIALICNAFYISLSERTKQIGLLLSVGATKKQIRRSVYFEAGCISLISIPTGLALGWLISAVIISTIGTRLKNLFFSYTANNVEITTLLSPQSFGIASLVAFIAVLFSVIIPAIRAMRITPISAIRESKEYTADTKRTPKRRLLCRILGLHGTLAAKYFYVSRRKYHITVFSLVISIVLFISAGSLGSSIQNAAQSGIQTENHDFTIFLLETEPDKPSAEEIRNNPNITKSAIVNFENHNYALTPDSLLSKDFQDAWNDYIQYTRNGNRNCQPTANCYIEDSVYREYLIEHGLEPNVYINAEEPVALLYRRHLNIQNGEDSYNYIVDPLKEDIDEVTLITWAFHDGLIELCPGNYEWDFTHSQNGELLIMATPFVYDATGDYKLDDENALYFEMVVDEDTSQISYFTYDMKKQTRGESAVFVTDEDGLMYQQKIGAHIDELPFGASTEDTEGYLTLILPYSAYTGPTDVTILAVNTSNYANFKAYLDENGLSYNDYYSEEEDSRTLLLLLNIFAYCFIISVSIISAANVISTISTSFMLRKREFAMLQSIGLTRPSLYRIAAIECTIYCLHSLIWGISIGMVVHYAIHCVIKQAFWQSFTIPLNCLLLSVCYAFSVSFLAMLFSFIKMRKINLIDVLKDVNT